MDFLDALKVLVRRWYVVTAGVLLIAAAAAVAVVLVPTGYQASAQYVLLLPADATGKATPTNPLLNLPEGLTITGSLLATDVSTKDTMRSLAKQGFTSTYAVALIPGAGPMLTITVDDTAPRTAVATRNAVIRWLDADLARIQDKVGVPPMQVITAQTTAVNPRAEVVPGRKIKALALIVGLGMVLTLVAAFTVDRLAPARKKAQEAARQSHRPNNPVEASRTRPKALVRESDHDRDRLVAEIPRARRRVR